MSRHVVATTARSRRARASASRCAAAPLESSTLTASISACSTVARIKAAVFVEGSSPGWSSPASRGLCLHASRRDPAVPLARLGVRHPHWSFGYRSGSDPGTQLPSGGRPGRRGVGAPSGSGDCAGQRRGELRGGGRVACRHRQTSCRRARSTAICIRRCPISRRCIPICRTIGATRSFSAA